MKNTRLFLSAFVVLSIVGSALAFSPKKFDQGSVYCNQNCTQRVDFRVQSGGTADPCPTGSEFVLVSVGNCQQSSGPFVSTLE